MKTYDVNSLYKVFPSAISSSSRYCGGWIKKCTFGWPLIMDCYSCTLLKEEGELRVVWLFLFSFIAVFLELTDVILKLQRTSGNTGIPSVPAKSITCKLICGEQLQSHFHGISLFLQSDSKSLVFSLLQTIFRRDFWINYLSALLLQSLQLKCKKVLLTGGDKPLCGGDHTWLSW